MKKLMFLTMVVCLLSCSKGQKWVNSGYVNPKNCNEFIVNDSIIIKSIGSAYTVFVNGHEVPITQTYKSTHKNDSEMINTLQWRYEHMNDKIVDPDYMINRKSDCIEIN